MCTDITAEPKIVAHRGASSEAPENTITAFNLAWEQGADAIECDAWSTKDSKLVCIHDGNTRRTASKALDVASSNLSDLSALRVGKEKKEHIPTLAEVMATVPEGKQVFVEVKGGVAVVPLLPEAVEEAGIKKKQLVVISFDKDVVAKTKRSLKGATAILLIDFQRSWWTRRWRPSDAALIKDMKETGADGVGLRASQPVDAQLVKDIRAANSQVHIWTVNNLSKAKYYQDLGVDSITTDRPKIIKSGIDQYEA
jgi:glycerophosphoryl diester phosphodiesterase